MFATLLILLIISGDLNELFMDCWVDSPGPSSPPGKPGAVSSKTCHRSKQCELKPNIRAV